MTDGEAWNCCYHPCKWTIIIPAVHPVVLFIKKGAFGSSVISWTPCPLNVDEVEVEIRPPLCMHMLLKYSGKPKFLTLYLFVKSIFFHHTVKFLSSTETTEDWKHLSISSMRLASFTTAWLKATNTSELCKTRCALVIMLSPLEISIETCYPLPNFCTFNLKLLCNIKIHTFHYKRDYYAVLFDALSM